MHTRTKDLNGNLRRFKDRQQSIWPILVESQYIGDWYVPPKILYTYYILLKSCFYGLSNGIKCIQIKRRMLIGSNSKFEKSVFLSYFFNNDISLNIT